MSNLLSTQAMVTLLKERLPMGLTDAFCLAKLNESFQWIEQRGPFAWDTRLTIAKIGLGDSSIFLKGLSVAAPIGDTATQIDMGTIDVGKPMTVWNIDDLRVPIPYKEPQEFANQQLFNTTPIAGIFSCWTLFWDVVQACFQIRFAPTTAKCDGDTQFAIECHVFNTSPAAINGSTYYPTPNPFDYLIVDLAEAEIRRLYRLAGWAETLQKAQASASEMIDKYRSTKLAVEGAGETTKTAQETQASRAE